MLDGAVQGAGRHPRRHRRRPRAVRPPGLQLRRPLGRQRLHRGLHRRGSRQAARVPAPDHLQRRRAGAAHRRPLPAAELADVLLPPAAREARRNPLRRALPRWRGVIGHDRDLVSHQRVPDRSQQSGQRRERDRLRVSPGRRRDAGARAAPALPREPRQLGSRAGRRAGARSASRDVRQRRGGRIDGHDAEHDRADGARCHRVPRGPRARRGRPPRLLDRQLRRPGDRADQAGGSPSPGPRVVSPARRRRDARLGTRGDRSRGRARAQPRRVPRRVLHALGREPASGRGDPGAADRTARRSGQADDLADPAGSIRRRVRLGHPGSRPAAAGQRDRHARVRGQRRRRPDDPAALLPPARRPDPAGAGEDLPGRGARVPVPAPRRVRPRRRRVPQGATERRSS